MSLLVSAMVSVVDAWSLATPPRKMTRLQVSCYAVKQHHVNISTHRSYWNFGFQGNSKCHLYCEFSPASADRIKRQKITHDARRKAGFARDPTANVWEDVSVIVGKVNQNGRPITVEDFREWMRVTVDLNRPSELVRTPYRRAPVSGRLQSRAREPGSGPRLTTVDDVEQEARTVTLIWETAIK
jgi:hypothetical protein